MKSFLKRSAVKQLACFLLAVIITVGFVPLPAQAYTQKYDNKFITLSQRKWVTTKGPSQKYNSDKDTWTDTYYLYKISVPANSFIRIDVKTKNNWIKIFKTVNRQKSPYDQDNTIYFDSNTVYRCVLPKGTYYLSTDGSYTLKWQSTTTKNPTNFCRSRSARLKAGYKKWEVFNYGYEFDRWYRISLTARKPITITMNQIDRHSGIDFSVYNVRGYHVTCNELNESNYRTTVLPKGTYYIRVYWGEYHDYADTDYGRICQFWWK